MSIPESQLEIWSHPGAMTRSEETHKSIRAALMAHNWPTGMTYTAYLQGSYPNATNIRGDSDVDLVVQTDAVFYSNLNNAERRLLALSDGAFSWADFQGEVINALVAYYGADMIDTSGNKSIKILPSGNRLPADVVPCVEYKRYTEYIVEASGMTFWTKDQTQIINYPKLHISNGAAKNSVVSMNFKPCVRMYKNARNSLTGSASSFPSYFLECMIYNVDDSCFHNSKSNTYVSVLRYLCAQRDNGGLQDFVTQNRQHYLFGGDPWQTSKDSALVLIGQMVEQWNTW
jgi:hypothetical protein